MTTRWLWTRIGCFLGIAVLQAFAQDVPPQTPPTKTHAGGAPDSTPGVRSGRVPLLWKHGLVFVEIGWRPDRPLLALVDTGASASAIDTRTGADLVLTGLGEVTGTTDRFEVEMVEVEGLRLGARTLPALRATRRPLTGLLSPDDRIVDLILGGDAWSDAVLEIDFGARKLELSDRPSKSSATAAPLFVDNNIPAIAARIGEVECRLRIDTGASLFDTDDVYVNVPTRLRAVLDEVHPGLAVVQHFQGTGAGGKSVTLPVIRAPMTTIAEVECERTFLVVQPEVGYFAEPEAKGFVSNNFLRKLGWVALDLKGERLLFVEPPGTGETDR